MFPKNLFDNNYFHCDNPVDYSVWKFRCFPWADKLEPIDHLSFKTFVDHKKPAHRNALRKLGGQPCEKKTKHEKKKRGIHIKYMQVCVERAPYNLRTPDEILINRLPFVENKFTSTGLSLTRDGDGSQIEVRCSNKTTVQIEGRKRKNEFTTRTYSEKEIIESKRNDYPCIRDRI